MWRKSHELWAGGAPLGLVPSISLCYLQKRPFKTETNKREEDLMDKVLS